MADLKRETITFFVPCLNEAGNIGRTLDTILAAMAGRAESYQIIVVDDASGDDSVAEVGGRMRRYPEAAIEVIRRRSGQGIGRNYRLAAQCARGDYFMLVNGDAVETADSIRAILSRRAQADAVVPYYSRQPSRPLLRRLLSNLFTGLVNFLSGHRLRYYNGPVLHRTEHVRRWSSRAAGFGYQAELLCRLLNEGISVTEVEIPHGERTQGASKAFRLRNCLSVAATLLRIGLRRLKTAPRSLRFQVKIT